MLVKIQVTRQFDVKILSVEAGVRYWEDATVNGVEDVDGSLIPFRIDDAWCPEIDIETGVVIDWPKGVTANIHYKVCDDGLYHLKDDTGEIVLTKNGYVPSIMCPNGGGYGDYIIMIIDENGKIGDWNPTVED